jgi:Fic family protein
MNWELTNCTLSSDIVRKLSRIEQLTGKVEGLQLSRPTPKLRAKNRARSVHGSTGIEGNSSSVKQVEAIARGEAVALSQKEQLEIRNALEACNALPDFDPFSVESLLDAHKILMGGGLLLSAGRFRTGPVEVYVTETETRAMPAWDTIESAMDSIFDFVRNGEDLMLFKSVRFHFEFVNLHPFFDGNGRVARLWQTRLLMTEHPVFEFLDVESMVFDRRSEYYEKIREAQNVGDAEGFVRFMFEQIERSLSNLWENSGPVLHGLEYRMALAADHFAGKTFSRKEYCQLFKTITPVTASRDLANGVKAGQLIRKGDKRTAVYSIA